MKRLLYLLFIFCALGTRAQQNFAIKGTVNDEKGAPLPGATVFITNSKYVTITNNEGKFNFDNIQPGTYEVVIKLLGFLPYVQSITINNAAANITAKLKESITTLNTVTISASRDRISAQDREKYLEIFIKNFIGETVNSQQCRLLNPEVLQFHFDSKTHLLCASADDFLIVENKALGYKLKYLLTYFEVDFENYISITGGSPYFEELQGNEAQQKKWEINRQQAYLNSERHFFRALINNTLKEDGFLVYKNYQIFPVKNTDEKKRDKKDPPQKLVYTKKLLPNDSLFIIESKNFKTLTAKPIITANDTTILTGIYVVYTGDKESALFYKTGEPIKLNYQAYTELTPPQRKRTQMSRLIPLADTITIGRNGNMIPAKGFKRIGYWGWQRIADLTPLDYFTEPVKQEIEQPEKSIKDTILNKYMTAMDTIRSHRPIEKLYLQTDKPYYNLGDTIRFKTYLLNADFLTPSTHSGSIYIELDDAAGRMAKRIMVPVVSGLSWGDIALDEMEVPQGSYTLRAYTNWMRNFGEDYIFKKDIYISPINGGSRLVKTDFKLDSIAGKNKVQAKLLFTDLDKSTIRLKDMQLRVTDGRHNLFKDKANTGMDGIIGINFDMADKTPIKNLAIWANEIGKGADTTVLTIPVTINRPENTDLQFMPEGGHLVAGIAAKVGLKAIGENGKWTAVSGSIYNKEQQEVATFRSEHLGMGSLELLPQDGEIYTAKVTFTNHKVKSYPLPVVQSSGTAIGIMPKGADSLALIINATADRSADNYYLVGQSRGIVCYASRVSIAKGGIYNLISTAAFPTGIARFTLFNSANQPVNERIVYIDHHDDLQVSINSNKPDYANRDSVALNIEVKDNDGKPMQSALSMAVIDDSQVKNDEFDSNILNNLLFASDLKGPVEQPGWYFENNSPEHLAALDDLLLTQGWVGYDWKDVLANKKAEPQFKAEKKYTIEGKVTNLFNKPIKKARVSLLQKQPLLALDTVTDDNGRFLFKNNNLYPADSAYYLVEVKNKDGELKSFIDISVDEFKPPVFASPQSQALPWYVNSDTTLLNNNGIKRTQLKNEETYKGTGHLLNEVNIRSTKKVIGSQNPFPYADITLDESDMNAAKKLSLSDLLQRRYKNNFYKIIRFGHSAYFLNARIVILIIDGKYGFPIDAYMNYLTAEDIKGIEVVYKITDGIYDWALTYITTYSGHGPFLKHIPGRYEYKPLPFTLPKQFYSPKYTVKNKSIGIGTDLRSTIHWEPNIITDGNGKATVSFFTADKPADYTIILEGTDLNGNLTYKRQKIKVGTNITAAK
jgi:hypothetical protein